MEPHLLEALRDGAVRARRTDTGQELAPEFWREGKALWEVAERNNPTMSVEVHRGELDTWLSGPKPLSGGARQGRPASYDWEGFWIEVVAVANHPDGLPQTQMALVDHMEGWFEDNLGKSPARSSIEEKVSRLYRRLAPGK